MSPSPALVRPGALPGHLRPEAVRSGVARGPHGLFQRRIRPAILGEPQFERELVAADICDKRPHVIAWDALERLVVAARAAGVDPSWLGIHSACRPVALQH